METRFSVTSGMDRARSLCPTDSYVPELAYALADRADSLPRMDELYAPVWWEEEGELRLLLLCIIGTVGFFRCRVAWRRREQEAREN